MSRIAKVYCSRSELAPLAPSAKLLENYDAFQLVSVSPAALKEIATKVPVEDVTKLYEVTMAGKKVDTSRPRYSPKGKQLAHSAYKGTKPLTKGAHHYLVQFQGPVKDAWIRQVEKAGGVYRSPYSNFVCVFCLTPAALAKVSSLPCVRWVGHLSHESRVTRDVFERPPKSKSKGKGMDIPKLDLRTGGNRLPDTLVIQFFDKASLVAAKPKFPKCGAKLISSDAEGIAVVTVPVAGAPRKAAVQALSAIHGVRLITPKTVPTKNNNVAVGFMGTARSTGSPAPALGLTGAGEIVAIADTGLDTGVAATVMPDFAGRVQKIFSWRIDPSFNSAVTNDGADDGPSDVDSGHGTHVSGSVLGGGSAGPGGAASIRGLAHQARLVFQAVEQRLNYVSAAVAAQFGNDPFQLAGLPTSLGKLFKQAFDAGARIHSDSWGGGTFGAYDSTSRALDKFVFEHPDFCVLVAAGNDGNDKQPGADGVVNEGSVSSPGTAKNCITVGASESERTEFATVTYADFGQPGQPPPFPVNPLRNDPVANHHDQMAAFSSRGPTGDGRIKPDVVAPGTAILSTRSTLLPVGHNGWGPFASNSHYMFDGGTSMATPLTAGAVTLVREFFRTRKAVASPSAALLKATLICGAQRMPLSFVPAGALVDNHQGFGRVNLDNVLAPAGGAVFDFRDIAPGLKTGQAFEVLVTAVASRQLRVVLAYSDYPGNGLKNNLNLLLIAPNGTRHVGNAGSGPVLTFDTKNNVELVAISSPAAGSWRVQVTGGNVPKGPQRFALAWLA